MTRLLTVALLAALLGTPALSQAPAEPAASPEADAAAASAEAGAPAEGEEEDEQEEGEEGSTAATPAASEAQHHDFGPSGIMTRSNRADLAPLTLASGKPVAAGEYSLQSGGYYRLPIVADGSAELALSGGDFFRSIWVNEIVVNDIEIRPMGVHSIEFDAAGEALISFIAITPGRYTLSVPGSSGESQQAVFNIR